MASQPLDLDQETIDAAREALRKDPDTCSRSGFGDRVIVSVQRGKRKDADDLAIKGLGGLGGCYEEKE